MKNLTAIYWIKNEARYIPEYIEFHLLQGFDYFIFYDNKSNDNLKEVISPYIDQGIAEIRYYPENLMGSKNFWLMRHCINEQKGKTRWLHFHALDERLFCPDGTNLIDLLSNYEQFGGLSVGWIIFNSNNHITRPDGLIIDNFTKYMNDDLYHIKTIFQPEKAIDTIGTPHNFIYYKNYSVDENFNLVDTSFNKVNYSFNKVKIHHYWTLSRQEFDEKQNKGLLDHNIENQRRPNSEEYWADLHDPKHNHQINNDLCKYSEKIKFNILQRYQNKKELLQFINH